MNVVRYGIAGFGRFAERAISPAIAASGNSRLVAIQKRSSSAAREKADEFGIPLSFGTVQEMVASPEVDAIFIVSANSTHREETLAAARTGKHVIVEKPMAMTLAEAEEMVAACAAGRVKLMVAHMLRFSPLLIRMRQLVQDGSIGMVLSSRADFIYDSRLSERSWLFDRAVAGGGPIFDIGVHCLDTLRYVLDDEVEEVLSFCEPPPTEQRTESLAHLLLRFSRRSIGTITCSFLSPIRRTYLEVLGSEGVLSAFDFTVGSRTTPLVIQRAGKGGETETRVEEIAVPNLYVEEITHFSDSIIRDRDPGPSGLNGVRNQRVLDLAMRGR